MTTRSSRLVGGERDLPNSWLALGGAETDAFRPRPTSFNHVELQFNLSDAMHGAGSRTPGFTDQRAAPHRAGGFFSISPITRVCASRVLRMIAWKNQPLNVRQTWH